MNRDSSPILNDRTPLTGSVLTFPLVTCMALSQVRDMAFTSVAPNSSTPVPISHCIATTISRNR